MLAIICVLLAGKQKRTNRKVSMALFCMEVDILREGFLTEAGLRSYSSYVYLHLVLFPLDLSCLFLSARRSASFPDLYTNSLFQSSKSKDQKRHGPAEIISWVKFMFSSWGGGVKHLQSWAAGSKNSSQEHCRYWHWFDFSAETSIFR